MDRLARTWVAQRVVLYIKHHRDQDSRRLSQVRDLLSAIPWQDLAPCSGCHLPFEKNAGFHCEECGRVVACSRACDPWKVFQCVQCKEWVCNDCISNNNVCTRCVGVKDSDVESDL